MAYAKIENNTVVEYPLVEGDLANRFPQYVFPLDVNEEVNGITVPEGYVRVAASPPPKLTANQEIYGSIQIDVPVLIDGVWTEQYKIILVPVEQRLDTQNLTVAIRNKIKQLLTESDVYVLPDRWVRYSTEQQQQWSEYRQALRDLTSLENFPLNLQETDWPIKPNS
jgi:hypothetical protein